MEFLGKVMTWLGNMVDTQFWLHVREIHPVLYWTFMVYTWINVAGMVKDLLIPLCQDIERYRKKIEQGKLTLWKFLMPALGSIIWINLFWLPIKLIRPNFRFYRVY